MCRTEPTRKSRWRSVAAALALFASTAGTPAKAADGFWDSMLETLNLKAAPPAPPPDFVTRSRPDPARLGYMAPVLPHKVSPLAVRSTDEIQARKDALDAAKSQQLEPRAPTPLQAPKPRKPARAEAQP